MDIYQTKLYKKWFIKLKDEKAKTIINTRLKEIGFYGNLGDYKMITENVSELRFDYGPGYRIYITIKNLIIVILLLGGDKDSQIRDIKKAEKLASGIHWEDFGK